MADKTILVIEKNRKIAYAMKTAVKRTGYKPETLESSVDILQYLSDHAVDVILINVRNVGSGAKSICSIIRNNNEFARFPLIIIYGKAGKLTRHEFLKQGADDFVPMPFTPADLIYLVKTRLRPLEGFLTGSTSLSEVDRSMSGTKGKLQVPPLEEKGALEVTPLPAILARLFLYRESGILTLILKKEARTIYIKAGEIMFAESMSRKDDLGDFMAKNRAGTGAGKEIIAARNQGGGPGSNPSHFSVILKETNLLKIDQFNWWMKMHLVDLLANLFQTPLGSFRWQSLALPDYAETSKIDPIFTPYIIVEGVRRIKKWWHCRDLLPSDESVPMLVPDFNKRAAEFGFSVREVAGMHVINAKRKLLEIREICHQAMPVIDNYIYTCQQLQLLHFDIDAETAMEESIDLTEELSDDYEPETEPVATVPVKTQAPPMIRTATGKIKLTLESLKKPELKTQPLQSDDALDDSTKPVPLPDFQMEKSEETQPVAAEPTGPLPTLTMTTGNISEKPVPEIYQHALECLYSGCIEFKCAGIVKKLYWKRAKIVSAVSTDIDERLDNFLFQKHLITKEQRNELRELPDDLIGSPNEILKRKFLSIEQIFTVVKEQVDVIVEDLFLWTDGTFLFSPNESAPQDIVPMNISAPAVMISGLRKIPDWEHLESFLPKPGDFIQIAKKGGNLSGLNLTAADLRIVKMLQNPLPVEEIIRQSGQEADGVKRDLYILEKCGVIKRAGGSS